MDHALVVSLQALTDPARLRVAGRLSTGPATLAELAGELGMPLAVVRRHLTSLVAGGLVGRTGVGPDAVYTLLVGRFHEIAHSLAAIAAPPGPADGPGVGPAGEPLAPDVARILRGYFDDDRLTAIPANGTKRAVVLAYLRDRCFTEDREYPEKEVNQRLALFHPDVAALRRYMVDGGLMTRSAGEYRRPAGALPQPEQPEPGSL